MNLWKLLLNFSGWNVDISAQRRDKCVICVAPHTSNWDFILGLFAYKSLERQLFGNGDFIRLIFGYLQLPVFGLAIMYLKGFGCILQMCCKRRKV